MDEDAAAAKEVAGRFGFNYPLLMGDAKFGHLYGGILGLPSAFLIGRDGRIMKILRSEQVPSGLDRAIQSALGSRGSSDSGQRISGRAARSRSP